MKIRHRKKGLPRRVAALDERIFAACDISMSRNSRIFLKLVVFKNRRDLQRWWTEFLERPALDSDCVGAVSSMATEYEKFCKDGSVKRWIEVDPRYFAVMGLSLDAQVSMRELVAHEAVHAAFAYHNRTQGRSQFSDFDFNEEHIAHPAGCLTHQIHEFLESL